ncbi:MAG: ferritin-like domain-containing protein [Steroidobacteraceae bacterium]
MSGTSDIQPVSSSAQLYAIAHEIETDAVERYNLLAEQMQTHNNEELARIFLDLARAEGLHAEEIRRLAGDLGVESKRGPIGTWRTESPESADLSAAHYLMTPRDALQMALAGEERALAFYTGLASAATDPAVKKLAEDFVEEELEHVELCHRLLRRYPLPTGVTADDDPDPPRASD